MWKDEILEEIYRIREEHAKAFNYDLQAICDDLRQKQAASNRQIISQPLKQPKVLAGDLVEVSQEEVQKALLGF
jgi:hypothetical protein